MIHVHEILFVTIENRISMTSVSYVSSKQQNKYVYWSEKARLCSINKHFLSLSTLY